eukprot:403365636
MDSTWGSHIGINVDQKINNLLNIKDDKLLVGIKIHKKNIKQHSQSPKHEFTVTEESEVRTQKQSTKKFIEFKTNQLFHDRPLKDMKRIQITLQDPATLSSDDPIKQRKILMQDKIKIREVLRTVENKQKEFNMTFHKNLQIQTLQGTSIQQPQTKDAPSSIEKKYKSRIKPISGQKLNLKMKSGAEINSMKIQYIKYKDQIYQQYLIQQQVNQKQKSILQLMKQIGIDSNQNQDLDHSQEQQEDEDFFISSKQNNMQIQDQQVQQDNNRDKSLQIQNQNNNVYFPPLNKNPQIDLDFNQQGQNERYFNHKVLSSKFGNELFYDKISLTPKVDRHSHQHSKSKDQSKNYMANQMLKQMMQLNFKSNQSSVRKRLNYSTIEDSSGHLNAQFKTYKMPRDPKDLRNFIELEKSILMQQQSPSSRISPDNFEKLLQTRNLDLSHECNKYDDYLKQQNEFRFLDAINGQYHRNELVFRTERNKKARPKMLTDADFNQYFKGKV